MGSAFSRKVWGFLAGVAGVLTLTNPAAAISGLQPVPFCEGCGFRASRAINGLTLPANQPLSFWVNCSDGPFASIEPQLVVDGRLFPVTWEQASHGDSDDCYPESKSFELSEPGLPVGARVQVVVRGGAYCVSLLVNEYNCTEPGYTYLAIPGGMYCSDRERAFLHPEITEPAPPKTQASVRDAGFLLDASSARSPAHFDTLDAGSNEPDAAARVTTEGRYAVIADFDVGPERPPTVPRFSLRCIREVRASDRYWIELLLDPEVDLSAVDHLSIKEFVDDSSDAKTAGWLGAQPCSADRARRFGIHASTVSPLMLTDPGTPLPGLEGTYRYRLEGTDFAGQPAESNVVEFRFPEDCSLGVIPEDLSAGLSSQCLLGDVLPVPEPPLGTGPGCPRAVSPSTSVALPFEPPNLTEPTPPAVDEPAPVATGFGPANDATCAMSPRAAFGRSACWAWALLPIVVLVRGARGGGRQRTAGRRYEAQAGP